jgi:hypothetical protein
VDAPIAEIILLELIPEDFGVDRRAPAVGSSMGAAEMNGPIDPSATSQSPPCLVLLTPSSFFILRRLEKLLPRYHRQGSPSTVSLLAVICRNPSVSGAIRVLSRFFYAITSRSCLDRDIPTIVKCQILGGRQSSAET